MSFFSIKDFTTGVAAKVRSVLVNTDENLPAHLIQDSAGNEVLGTKTDAKSTSTDTTSVSFMQVFKQISASVQALVTAIGSTAWDLGTGTSGTRTQRVVIDTGQLAALLSAYVPIATTNATQVALPTDHPTLAVAQDTARILNGVSGTSLTPKFATITASSSGATTVVAAVTSKKIRVLAWDLTPNAAVNAKWQSHVTPTDLTGLYYMGGQGNGQSRSFNPVGWFQTVAGEALDINLSGAVAVGGCLVYVEV